MKQLNFNVKIGATPAKVWEALWSDEGYAKWTKPFSPTSKVESTWDEGATVLFTDGKGNGLVSTIAEKEKFKRMYFKHIGEMKDGARVSSDGAAWMGAFENYDLNETEDGGTELLVSLQTQESEEKYFNEKFPESLQIVKKLAEQDQA